MANCSKPRLHDNIKNWNRQFAYDDVSMEMKVTIDHVQECAGVLPPDIYKPLPIDYGDDTTKDDTTKKVEQLVEAESLKIEKRIRKEELA